MSIEFEGKQYQSVAAIKREWFAHRSSEFVRMYINLGCKTVPEVVAMTTQREREGRLKSIAGARRGTFGGRVKTA